MQLTERPRCRAAVELALLTQRRSASARQKRVMEANHLWFGQAALDISDASEETSGGKVQSLRKMFEPEPEPEPEPELDPDVGVLLMATGPLDELQRRSARRKAELEAAQAELAELTRELERRNAGTEQGGAEGERQTPARSVALAGRVRDSPHRGCQTIIV